MFDKLKEMAESGVGWSILDEAEEAIDSGDTNLLSLCFWTLCQVRGYLDEC